MCSRRLRAPERTPSAIALGIASIAGYRLTFDKVSSDGSGKCDIEPDATRSVWGVVFSIEQDEAANLDRAEGLGKGYEKKSLVVQMDSGSVTTVAYVATKKDPSLEPFHWYKNFVLAGAREHQLPSDYIAEIETVPSRDDPDGARAARQAAVLE